MGVIYKITSPNGREYVGKTNNLKNRLKEYMRCRVDNQRFLSNSIRKYGWENHKFEVLFEVDNSVLNYMEKVMIKACNTFYKDNPLGMNLTRGGEGIVGFKHRKSSIIKMSKNSTGKKHTEETKKKIGESGKGRVVSIEARIKSSNSQKGEKNHRYGKGVSVVLYNLNGDFIREFKTANMAAAYIGCFGTSIIAVCKGREKSIKGFICKYKTEEYPLKLDLTNYYLRKQKVS